MCAFVRGLVWEVHRVVSVFGVRRVFCRKTRCFSRLCESVGLDFVIML